jgi:hypothetical protein
VADDSNGKIVSMKPDGTDVKDVVTGLSTIIGIALDPTRNRIYWADDVNVKFASLASPDTQEIFFTKSANYAESPTVDTVTDRVYWVDYDGGGKVFSKSPSGGDATSVTLAGACATPEAVGYTYSVAVDGAANKMYVAGYRSGSGGLVVRANLDGTGCEDLALVSDGVYGLTLDADTNTLYVPDYRVDKILSINLATKAATELTLTGATVSRPAYMALTKSPKATTAAVSAGTVGSTLSCDIAWSPGVIGAFLYRAPQGTPTVAWQRGGTTIAGATAATFTPTKAGSYTCSQTAANFAGSTTATSSASVVAAMVTVVKPSGAKLKFKSGKASLKVKVGGAGKVVVSIKSGSTVVATGTATATKAGTVTVKLKLTAKGKKVAKKGGSTTVTVTGTPTGGTASKATLANIKDSGR